jgi:hypothetical protein
VRNETPLFELAARLQPVWSSLELVSDRSAARPVIGLPALTADAAGNLYALWAQSTGPQANTVLAASLANDGRWTRPSTVLRSPLVTGMSSSQVAQPAITLSTEDKIHAVWTAGVLGPVYYSWAYARDFTSAQIWLEPIALPSPSANASAPDIASDPRRSDLYVIYAVPYNEARGVYVVHSLDGGTTWLTPTLVFDAVAVQWPSIDKARIALDPVTNVLHATWLRTALPGVPGTQAVYYALSVDQGRTWSSAVKMAEGAVDWPRIAVSNVNQVYLAWNQRQGQSAAGSAVPDGVWGTASNDGGARWSNPSPVSGFGEVSGPIGLYASGTGPLYLAAVGQDVGNQSALLWTQWNGQSWNPREVLPLGQGPAEGNAAAIVYAPATAQLSAVLRLQVWDQDNKGRFEVATTGRRLEPLAFTPVPTFTPMPTNTPTVVPPPEPTATPRPQLPTSSTKPAGAGGGTSPLILGGLLAAVIVAVAVTGAMIVRKR